MQRFRIGDLAPVPWFNQGGVTREIGCGRTEQGAPGAWDWRLSVATIDRDGPFSALPGICRTSVLVDGAIQLQPLEASGSALCWDAPGDMHRYDGETAFQARLRSCSARFFNVMVRRGCFESDIQVHRRDAGLSADRDGPRCLLVLAGRFWIESSAGVFRLDAEEGLLCLRGSSPVALGLDTPSGCLVDVGLRRTLR